MERNCKVEEIKKDCVKNELMTGTMGKGDQVLSHSK